MKKVLVFIICFLLTTSLAWAETPESISKSYFEFVKHQKWDEISGLYDPVALRDFREMMSFLIEVPDEKSSVVLARFFGPGTTKASLKAMSDASFFSSFLKSTMSMAVQLGQLDFKKIDVLGSVPEGTNLRHVVARTFTGMGEMSMEQMNVISFKKTNEGWKMLMQAKMKGMAQQLKRTISLFGTKTALSESPVQDGGSYFKRGNSYLNEGQYDKAISEYSKAIEINPKDNKAYTKRGLAYGRRGQFDQAISDFNKAIEINPKDNKAYNNRGFAYSRRGQFDQAISDYNKAIEINPKYNKAYTNRGAAYARRGQFDQAISDYNKAIEINPTNTNAYYGIGCIYSLQNNLSKALKYLELALENGHNNFDWISKDPDWDNI
ncbi:MAG: tetratricopeptide repeat protein, partial [Desulfobacteraceae bacterium]|nr:tetratricopeptide repeat protein [Desulfobacteraceae bacterium]